jgi:hypothetical protein
MLFHGKSGKYREIKRREKKKKSWLHCSWDNCGVSGSGCSLWSEDFQILGSHVNESIESMAGHGGVTEFITS